MPRALLENTVVPIPAKPAPGMRLRAGRWQYSYEEQAMARIHESMNRREEIGSERSPAGTSDLLVLVSAVLLTVDLDDQPRLRKCAAMDNAMAEFISIGP
jgi:hypothetical protein